MKKTLLLLILIASAFIGRAQTAMATADDWFAKKSYANASNYYSQVLTKDTANIKALRRMGFCVMNLPGDELNAAGYFYRALRVDPKDAASNYYLGVVYMDKAKQTTDSQHKAGFKAKAADYLNRASQYGNPDAKAAIRDLNAI